MYWVIIFNSSTHLSDNAPRLADPIHLFFVSIDGKQLAENDRLSPSNQDHFCVPNVGCVENVLATVKLRAMDMA